MRRLILILVLCASACSLARPFVIDLCLGQVREWFPRLTTEEHASICEWVVDAGSQTVDGYCHEYCPDVFAAREIAFPPIDVSVCEYLCGGVTDAKTSSQHEAGSWFALIGKH